MVAFVTSGDVLTVFVNGQSRQVFKTDHNYQAVVKGLSQEVSDNDLEQLIAGEVDGHPSDQLKSADFAAWSDFDVDDSDLIGEVQFDGCSIDNVITDYFARLKADGLPLSSMVAFTRKLYRSIEHRVRMELLSFIVRNGLTITNEGNVLFYKAVRSDYMDKYSGTFSNAVGETVTMDRDRVNADRTRHCAAGLHCGGLEYIYWYGGGDDRIIIVEVDPRDVISVPEDCGCRKVRTCGYTVISDYQGKLSQIAYDPDTNLYSQDEDEEDIDWEEFSQPPRIVEDDDLVDSSDVEVVIVGGHDVCIISVGDDDDDDDNDDLDDDDYDGVDEDKIYGEKPSGHKYWNVRSAFGRFTKRPS